MADARGTRYPDFRGKHVQIFTGGDGWLTRRSFVGLGAALLAGGCTHWPGLRRDQPERPLPATAEAPPAANLVAYLNTNARLVQAVQCDEVAMDCMQGRQAVGLDGKLVCQKPRDFRLKANLLGQPAVDIGSNDNEFWYWISKIEPVPYVFHCGYAELARGNVRMPFPFQPDMVVAALGIQEYDPAKAYEVKATPSTFELVESTTTPQGQPAQKVTVFNRVQATGNRPQVIGHVLRDAQGKEICSATVYEVEQNRQTGVVLPIKVKLSYPAEKVEMTLKMWRPQPVTIDRGRAEVLFTRANLARLPSFDLARWAEDAPGGGVRPAGGIMR
jgi:hypothetical protein